MNAYRSNTDAVSDGKFCPSVTTATVYENFDAINNAKLLDSATKFLEQGTNNNSRRRHSRLVSR